MDAPMEKRRNVWTARTTFTLAGGISWAMMAFAYRYDGGWGFRTWPRMMLLIFPALFFAARQWMMTRETEKRLRPESWLRPGRHSSSTGLPLGLRMPMCAGLCTAIPCRRCCSICS